MSKMRLLKKVLIIAVGILVISIGTVLAAIEILEYKTNALFDNISEI